jgi:hypothetical protein
MVLLTTPPQGDGPAWPFFLLSLILMVVVLLPTYVLNALPLYSIASRRKLKAAWLAWIPIGSAYILGLISDDYQLLALGNDKNRRIWLPVLHGLTVVLIVVFMVCAFFSFGNEDSQGVAWLPFFLAAMVVCVVVAVMKWMATYDLFRSCEPDRAGVYLAVCLGVRFVMPSFSIVREILMLVVSGKDLGMPRLNLLENRKPAERPNRAVKEPWDI